MGAEYARAGQVHLQDVPAPIQRHITDRRKIKEVGISFQAGLDLQPRPVQVFILHFQFNLVHLQFLQEPAHAYVVPSHGGGR